MSPHGEHKGESATNGAQNGAHTNGTQTNGTHTNGHDAREKGVSEKVVQPTETQKSGNKKTSSTGALMQLRRASRRPLPTEMGDGTYRNILRRPTLMQDLKSFGLGGEYIQL